MLRARAGIRPQEQHLLVHELLRAYETNERICFIVSDCGSCNHNRIMATCMPSFLVGMGLFGVAIFVCAILTLQHCSPVMVT